jgi:cystathionine beta-lyase/cystathionine gamma-synthase
MNWDRDLSLATRLVHSGEPSGAIEGAVTMPIFQSATYTHSGQGQYHAVRYARLNNTPNHDALHTKLADICGAEAALVTSSGMSAITTALLTVLGSGDQLLVQDTVYGGTHSFLRHDAPRLGIQAVAVDPQAPESWAAALTDQTRAIYVESMTNPLLQVADLEQVVAFARAHGLVSMIDNTFASPCNFRPVELGFDLSLHSATKYLNGHSDVVAGCVVGRAALVDQVRQKLNHLGGSLDPNACFLLQRGLKTLTLRVAQQNHNAMTLATLLRDHPAIGQVHYAGLPEHPQHQRAAALFQGFGGVLSFTLKGGVEAADAMIERLHLPQHAPSLGGVETLITRPATTSHAGLSPQERAEQGISDALVRLAVGIESSQDLCADFTQALQGLA